MNCWGSRNYSVLVAPGSCAYQSSLPLTIAAFEGKCNPVIVKFCVVDTSVTALAVELFRAYKLPQYEKMATEKLRSVTP
ncbi:MULTISPECIES: hypothetical protein [unclassified Microcoleus]|uniref:hypothetical protein n=1 Tax=unclassified Microcoleus TaxID=2642155 RepID=UPI002FCE9FAB